MIFRGLPALVVGLIAACCARGEAFGPAHAPQLPFAFVENKGQADPSIRFIGSGPNFSARFTCNEVLLSQRTASLRLEFQGGRSCPQMEGITPTGAVANYFYGSDSARWITDVRMYEGVILKSVWPGIDVRFQSHGGSPKAEYVVHPGADPARIRLRFNGRASVDADGGLTVRGETGVFHDGAPILFQPGFDDVQTPVEGALLLEDDGTVGFRVGRYNRERELIVDPTILFSGYFGGSSQASITAVAVNSYYNTIIAGWTASIDLPAGGGARIANSGGVDAFVAAFGPAGGGLLYCTYLGGSGDDRAAGIAVDSANNTYITGYSSSANFPVAGAAQSRLSGARDAFVTKLSASGNTLVYSTYLGGSGVDTGNAIVVDPANAAFIVGDTTSTNLPGTAGRAKATNSGGQDVFVMKVAANGASVLFASYLGGAATDHGTALQLDNTGFIYVTGSTFSANFPAINAAQAHSGGGQDAFLTKFSADASTFLFSTYFGGSGGSPGFPEEAKALSITYPGARPTIAGVTSSLDLPVTSDALQKTFGGGHTDGFVARFDVTGALIRAGFLGGNSDDGINSLVTDVKGYLYAAGYTQSTDFPVQNATQAANAGGMDAFVTKMSFTKILYSTYLGGPGNDAVNAITLDSEMSITCVGTTSSPNLPVVGSVGAWSGSTISSFLTKIATTSLLALSSSSSFFFDVWHNSGYNGPGVVTLNSSTFGSPGDLPVAGDWDGTGHRRLGVFRNGMWLLDMNGNGVFDSGDKIVTWGQAGDLPVTGDWNGTGSTKLGLFRQGTFLLDLSGHLAGTPTGVADAVFSFGATGDLPIAADWNGSGSAKVGVFRSGMWLVDYNGDRVFNSLDKTYSFGQAGDIPVVGDWVGTGVFQIGVYRQGAWILDYDGDNALLFGGQYDLVLGFGGSSFSPLVL